MKRVLFPCLMLGLTACGSTGTEATGTEPTPEPGSFCGSFAVGPGLICDTSTSPHTLRIDFGAEAGKVAEGSDARFPSATKGHFLNVFTPTVIQGNPVTLAQPGGLMALRGGGLIYDANSGAGGIRAANAICAAITNFPGRTEPVATAHACSNDELLQNAHAGRIPAGASGMAYMTDAYAEFFTTGDETNNNFKSSCGNWTYDSQDLYTSTEWTVEDADSKNQFDDGMAVTVRFTSATTPDCTAVRPIACCE